MTKLKMPDLRAKSRKELQKEVTQREFGKATDSVSPGPLHHIIARLFKKKEHLKVHNFWLKRSRVSLRDFPACVDCRMRPAERIRVDTR